MGTIKAKISLCPKSGCNYKCCNFDVGNYILLFPGELNQAIAAGLDVNHLQILEKDSLGGHKVICKAENKSNCENGYKPLDCMFYPFFPLNSTVEDKILKGSKCPLSIDELTKHLMFIQDEMKDFISLHDKDKICQWLEKVQMVGYDIVKI